MRHIRNAKRSGLPRMLIVTLLIAAITVGSVVTAVANSVDITVYDGEDTYSFSMIGADSESILARAETEGMEPVSPIDECVFSESSTVLTVKRNVRLVVEVDGEVHSLVVPRGSVLGDTLGDNGIELSELDEISVPADSELTADTRVTVRRSSTVEVMADGKSSEVSIIEGTVADALEAAGIELRAADSVQPGKTEALEDGMQIQVSRRISITINADGEKKPASVTAYSYEQALAQAGVKLSEDDLLYSVTENGEKTVERGDCILNDAEVRVERITREEIALEEIIEHGIVYQEVDGKYRDQEKTVTRGVDGKKRVTYEVTYADGVEVAREALSEEIIKEAVDAVIERGSKLRADAIGNGTFVDHTGATVGYDWSITGECTAYSWEAGSVTAMGTSVQVGYVAVNPNVIPYGSLLYITSPNGEWNYGYCYAMDTGGAAMSGRIVADLFYDSEDYCNVFGRRQMTVYVIEEGKWPDGWK